MLLHTFDYTITQQDLTPYRQELENDNPDPPSFPSINDADIFRVLFHWQPELKRDPDKAIDAVPGTYLESLHKRYCKRLIATTPPLEAALDPDDINVHGHLVMPRLFEVVVYVCGKNLNERHGNINWYKISQKLGVPFELEPNFAYHIRHYYYLRVAPFVQLWSSVVRLVEAQLELTASFPPTDMPHPSPAGVPQPESVMNLLNSAIRELDGKVGGPIAATNFALLPASGTSLVKFISTIATTPQLRAVARSLPSHIAHVLMHAIQWVLNQDVPESYEVKAKIIKLFQDTVNDSHELPAFLFVDGLTIHDSIRPREGGEAFVYFGELNSKAVAVRVPNYYTGKDLNPERFTIQKRYNRAIIQQHQLRHKNLIDFLGLWTSPSEVISLVMPAMDHVLSSHTFKAAPGPYVDMVTGIAEGLEHLHRHRIAHGDLHWRNILVDQTDTPKIADFGISRIDHREGNTRSTDPLLSSYIAFMPHEIRENQDWSATTTKTSTTSIRPTMSTDLFSCGMVFIALALPELHSDLESQISRFTRLADQFAKRDAVKQRPMFASLPSSIASLVWNLILEMTKWEAGQRLSMSEVRGYLKAVSQAVQEPGYMSQTPPHGHESKDGVPAITSVDAQPVGASPESTANEGSQSKTGEGSRSKTSDTESGNKAVDLRPQGAARPGSSTGTNSPGKRRRNAKSEVNQESKAEASRPEKRARRSRRAT